MEETKFTGLIAGEAALPNEGSIIIRAKETAREEPAPVLKSERIGSIDIVRGVALLGILLMNIPGFGIDNSAFYEILTGPANNADYITLGVMASFFEGTMRGLFSMLFGAGMILFTLNKTESPGGVTVAEYYYRRLMWLVAFGLLNAYVLLWPGDILYFYGLTGMLLYTLRKTSVKWLILLGLMCFMINVYKGMSGYNDLRDKRAKYLSAVKAEKESKTLTDEQKSDKEAWLEVEKNQKPDAEVSNRNVQKVRSGYGTVFSHLMPTNSNIEIWGMYHGVWDVLGMMLIGMALFTLGFFSNKLSSSTYAMGVLIGYGIGIPIGYIIFKDGWAQAVHISRYVDSFRVPHWMLYDLKRVLLSIGHASVVMLIIRSRLLSRLMNGLGNVGQMAFTNYLMQTIICTLIFFGYGLGYYDKLRFYQLYYIVAGVWIFQIIFSSIWLRYFRFGPFEWLWRSLTYGKFQPMKNRT